VSRAPRASGYFRTSYAQDLALVGTRLERTGLGVLILALLAFPFMASAFQLDLACQVFLACVGALSLMLLTAMPARFRLGTPA
jgi:branched-chain amino acid transport system permease protein